MLIIYLGRCDYWITGLPTVAHLQRRYICNKNPGYKMADANGLGDMYPHTVNLCAMYKARHVVIIFSAMDKRKAVTIDVQTEMRFE